MTWIYKDRKLAEAYPGLEDLSAEFFRTHQSGDFTLAEPLARLARLIRLGPETQMVVIGCGPKPRAVADLLEQGYDVFGVEPVRPFLEAAKEYLGAAAHRVSLGAAEALPYEDESKDVVILESVLEHVDSPQLSIAEAFRVLRPGGVAYVETTNRHRFRLSGMNGEFRVPFFNWFPRVVQESYVFTHLHYEPKLSNYATRPAVHWFTFADLCRLGRAAGFAQFYHGLDLVDPDSHPTWGRRGRRWIVRSMRTHPWFRALVLSQKGGTIYMWKRGAAGDRALPPPADAPTDAPETS